MDNNNIMDRLEAVIDESDRVEKERARLEAQQEILVSGLSNDFDVSTLGEAQNLLTSLKTTMTKAEVELVVAVEELEKIFKMTA